MIELQESTKEDLKLFSSWEKLDGIREFICPYAFERHVEEFEKNEVTYLKISFNAKPVGFVLLKLEDDERSVEFRRIVVIERGKGIGQKVLNEIENYCLNKLKRKRIWLDVFEFNKRGIHIYKKQGYKMIDEIDIDDKRAFVYEKLFDS
ncbi:MAG: GNAT family N-acetyltransferase [Ignavibacterium sp.]|nr:MAG: GNAT family N-acetyltransferase [Ignavibacterium sp.]